MYKGIPLEYVGVLRCDVEGVNNEFLAKAIESDPPGFVSCASSLNDDFLTATCFDSGCGCYGYEEPKKIRRQCNFCDVITFAMVGLCNHCGGNDFLELL